MALPHIAEPASGLLPFNPIPGPYEPILPMLLPVPTAPEPVIVPDDVAAVEFKINFN